VGELLAPRMSWSNAWRRLSPPAAGAALGVVCSCHLGWRELHRSAPATCAAAAGPDRVHPLPTTRPAVLLERLQPFSSDALLASGLDPSDCTYAELSPKGELAQLVSSFVASSPGAHSFSIDLGSKSAAGRTRAVAARRACVALGVKFILAPPCIFH
jgi:hypothetical protein